jgi:chromosome segregation ATPase
LRQAQAERDEAQETSVRLRSDLEDAVQRLGALERELESRTTYFANYKGSLEEQHAAYAHALQDELASNRQLYEREIEDMRRELSEQTAEMHLLEQEVEQERGDRQAAKAAARTLEDEVARLRVESSSQSQTTAKLEEKLRKVSSENEQLRQSQATLETKLKEKSSEVQRLTTVVESQETVVREERTMVQQQHSTLEADWKESERLRQQLQDEVRKLRQRVAEETQWKSLKDRLDRDREHLMAENVRLHQQYQEVQSQNVQQQHVINQLKARMSTSASQSAQMDDLAKRLAEIPALRQAAEDSKQEAMRAREQLEVARQERAEMAERLEAFMEETRTLSRKDQELEQLFRDASQQVRRLDHQIGEAAQTQQQTKGSRGAAGAARRSPSDRNSPVRPWRRQS